MTDKDPKDMTASELVRWATNGEPYNGVDGNRWTYPTEKIKALVEDVTGEWPSDHEAFSIIADKIDAELAEARKDAIRESKKPMWWFRNAIKCGYDWPEPRDGEKFRDYLHRCFLPRPRFEDGEPVQLGDRVLAWGEDHTVERIGIEVSGGGCLLLQYIDSPEERLERPAPEVLGADGLPLKVGEVVYSARYGHRNPPITSVHKAGDTIDGFPAELDFVRYEDGYDWAKDLTHTPPDTQERIDEDKGKKGTEYWRCVGFLCGDCPAEIDGKRPSDRYGVLNCSIAQGMDIARRQADLDARKGGE